MLTLEWLNDEGDTCTAQVRDKQPQNHMKLNMLAKKTQTQVPNYALTQQE